MLFINNLNVKVNKKLVVNNLNLNIFNGEIHTIIGPNGSGKSSLSLSLIGDKKYKIVSGNIYFMKKNITKLSIYERSLMGIFLSFQNPIEITGISNFEFLKNISDSIRKYKKIKKLSIIEFKKKIKSYIKELKIDESFLEREVNVSFSGGEKKKNEILQMKVINPKFLILDEIDSGLDIDTLKTISISIKKFINKKNKSCIIITHRKNILNYINSNHIHIMINGKIVKTGDINLFKTIEKKGYEWIKN